jgi:nitronate monooxygenase
MMDNQTVETAPGAHDEILRALKLHRMPALKIGDSVARLPIIQGGMAVGISLSGLASAVANAGGIGVIATAGIGLFEPDFYTNCLEACARGLRNEIHKARQKTRGVLGANIMVALSNYDDMVKAAVEEGIDIIFSGAGLPLGLPGLVGDNRHTSLVPIVSSGRAARLLCMKWRSDFGRLPDAFVVEGPLAGGHLGFKADELNNPENQLERLVPDVIREVAPFEQAAGRPIPVIAGGGIFSGADIQKFIKLGASGVQMATRFVTTEECDAHPDFKEAYIKARPEDVIIIKSPVGMPGRALRNSFLDEVAAGHKKPFRCPYHCVRTCKFQESPYCIFFALVNAQRGHLAAGFAFCGANAHRLKKITTVKKLMRSLVSEYSRAARTELGETLARYLNQNICLPQAASSTV